MVDDIELVEKICELIGTVLAVVPTVVSLVILIVNIIKNKNWDLVKQMAKAAMVDVEKYAKEHPEMTSDDKLNMALVAVKAACTEAGITLDEDAVKRVIALINDLCALSKQINYEAAAAEA